MQTRFFKFPDNATAFSLALAAGLTRADEHNEQQLVSYTDDYALDVIGVMHRPTGEMIEGSDGLFFPEMIPADGWHVNARILSGEPLPESFAQYEVFPSTPSRVFA